MNKLAFNKIILPFFMIMLCLMLASCNLIDIEKIDMPTPRPVVGLDEHSKVLDKGPEKGGVLTIASTGFETLNPLVNKNYFMKDVLSLIYEGLVTLDTDYKPVPLLCESFGSTPDSTTWTFNLKKGVKWHNGTEFTASDVQFTINTLIALPGGYYKSCVKNIVSVNVPDAYTVTITYSKPDSFAASRMFFPILPKHRYAEGVAMPDPNVDNKPVGTGMYKFVSAGQDRMVLKANDSWHGNKSGQKLTQPYISTVEVDFYKTVNDIINSDADIISVKSRDITKGLGKIGYGIKKYVDSEFEIFSMNNSEGAFSDKNVRMAVALSLNKDANVKKLSGISAASSDLPIYPEAWINPTNATYYPYNQDKAVKLLQDNGWTLKNDKWYKVVNGRGTYIEFDCLVNETDTDKVTLAENFSQELKKIKIIMNVVKEKQDKLVKNISEGKYDAVIAGITIPSLGDLTLFYRSSDVATNIARYNSTTVDQLFDQLMSNSFDKERIDIFENIRNKIVDDVPFLGLYFKEDAIFYNKRIRGIDVSRPGRENRFRGIEGWYIPGSSGSQPAGTPAKK